MTCRLHGFKMDSGARMAEHLNVLDEVVVGLQTPGEPVDDLKAGQLAVRVKAGLFYRGNFKDITPNEVKKKLLKDSEKLQKKEATETAFLTTEKTGG
ncbi:uncharacterized protein PHALS_14426 [Plasmopara halstedii]|uniref:Uncharacterized protein n=1 Tax=Plasmopara halstedii TaxID=4781 RepID=A0A0P1ASZ6_PLAHL|nr:uncharacterized protein PHALS_14426 [Plasmopara halstedii]CEG44168.1 hypothetical protein PHALS_14426 [Plasmopara halstedii]|eukprot:XP_024580537.1 hypothetical protein PHALS_14426 [Plasmopara halstedii]